MKKSAFLTFVFAFMPGAGQMYLGLMKKGITIMALFFGVTFISSWFGINFTVFVLPVIWFYSFFDTMNLKDLSDEQRMHAEEKFMNGLKGITNSDLNAITNRRHVFLGGILIFAGLYMIFRNFARPYLYLLNDTMPWLSNLINDIPTLVIAIIIIALGVYMVRGNIKSQIGSDDYKQFGGKQDGE